MKNKLRKTLSMPALMGTLKKSFSKIPDNICRDGIKIADCLLSGFAVFSLKYASLMSFDEDSRDEAKVHNLKSLYQVDAIPSDTYMRRPAVPAH